MTVETAGAQAPFVGPAFDQLAKAIERERCILFLGAGVHHPPPDGSPFTYPEADRPPLGGALARTLAAECEFERICPGESDTNLQRVALCYQVQLERPALIARIRQAVDQTTQPSAAVRGLADLPFPMIMTTNYDTLFERALVRSGDRGKRPTVLTYEPRRGVPTQDFPDDVEPTAEAPFLFKMHGDFATPESIVVTDEDYITFVLRMNEGSEEMHPVPQTLRFYLRRYPVLFVGYGLLDFNLRLLFRTLRWRVDPVRSQPSFSVDVRPDPLVRTVWSKELGLSFIVEDAWSFVPRLYRQVLGREMPA